MSDLPLPAPYYPQWSHSNEHAAYNADQLRSYAAACVASERERWTAGVCNALAMLRSGDVTLADRMLAELVGA